MEINIVKGVHDVFDKEANAYTQIENLMKSIAELFAYNEVRSPILEHSEVFSRGVGESSDIVRKEMYDFLDKGGRSLTLRPEFTAGVMRLIISNKLYATSELPIKMYYCGPLFRYERPQLGRYRQFNQFGVESVGNDSLYNDVEVIILAYTILQSLGLEDVKLVINTLGDKESRDNYRSALKEYFAKYIDGMCPDCEQRFETNPLRILDCKIPEDQNICKGAPKISDYLSEASKSRFNKVLETLSALQIPYDIDDNLVRGLDYYSETVFEFHYRSQTGNDYGAVGGGGHYGNLMKELGGPELPGVGFSFGVERIYSVLKDDNLLPDDIENNVEAYVMPMSDDVRAYALDVASTLRMAGYRTEMCFDNTKLGNMFKRATKKGASYAIIIGEDEFKNQSVVVKDMAAQEQDEVNLDDLVEYFDSRHGDDNCECGCGHHHDENHECCCGHHTNDEEEHECCCGHHHKEEK